MNHYLQSGSLLGDSLDIAYSYGKSVKTAFGFAGSSNDVSDQSTPQITVLEQDLTLSVTTLASARRAAKIMMPRLAPMPPDQLEWDIAGPHIDAPQAEEGKHIYSIGFVKTADLEVLNEQGVSENGLAVPARYGGVYRFRSTATLVEKRKKTLLVLLGFAACYCCLLWAGLAWAERPARITDAWQKQTRQARLGTGQNRETLQRLETRKVLIGRYQSNTQGADLLQVLSTLAQSLPDGAWVREVNYGNRQIKINGFTDNPAKLATLLEAKTFVRNVELGSISSDRASGLQRFNLTLFIEEQKP